MAQFKRPTTTDLITNGKYSNAAVGTIIETLGYTAKGDGGGAQWKKTGNTVTASQSPGQLAAATCSDAAGNEFAIVVDTSVNAKSLGAIGDGVTDDNAAILACVDYALSSGGGHVYFPPGDYLLNSQVSKSVTSAKFRLFGDGVGSSRILVNNAVGGISIAATDRETEAVVQDLEFVANRTPSLSSGVGLEITMPEGGNRHNRSVILQNVKTSVINENNTTTYGYWDTAINLTGCWRPYLTNVVVSGPFGPGISDDLADSSPIYKTAVGVDIDGCYGPEIHDCYVWSCDVGISNTSTASPGPEGFRMTDTNIVEVKSALAFSRVGQEPTIWIDNCHYNYRDRGLDIDGSKLVIIRGCAPYNVDTTPEFGGTPEDIYLDNTSAVIIAHNTFHFDGNTNRRNISIVASTAADDITIHGNTFNAAADKAILVGASATNVYIMHNSYPGTITTEVDDLSNNANIVDPISITKGTWTPALTFGGASVGLTTSSATGNWMISGNVFHYDIEMTLTAKGTSTGNAEISLPGSSALPGNQVIKGQTGTVIWSFYSGMAGIGSTPSGRIVDADSIRCTEPGVSAISNMDDTNFTNSSSFRIQGTIRFDV
jgi:hypothetical protein